MQRRPVPPVLSGIAAHGCLFLSYLLVRAVFVVSVPFFLMTLSGPGCSFHLTLRFVWDGWMPMFVKTTLGSAKIYKKCTAYRPKDCSVKSL